MEVVVTGEATVALLFNTINYVKFIEELEDLECADKHDQCQMPYVWKLQRSKHSGR